MKPIKACTLSYKTAIDITNTRVSYDHHHCCNSVFFILVFNLLSVLEDLDLKLDSILQALPTSLPTGGKIFICK